MAPPTRVDRVRELAAQHPEAFPVGVDNDARRLVFLREIVIPALNVDDGGDWGLCTKTDQRLPDGSYKIPCDILMWRATRETVDCLTGTGATWQVQGVAPIAWVWTPVASAPPPPSDQSVPVLYLPATVPLVVGTIVPQSGDQVVLINAIGQVVSVRENGAVQLRDPGDVAGWELATRVGPTLLRYDGTGTTYYLPVQGRPL